MINSKIYLLSLTVAFALTLVGCIGAQPATELPVAISTESQPIVPAMPVGTDEIGEPSTLHPTPIGSSKGAVIYDDGEDIVSINPDTGESKVLVSRKELQFLLGEDRSAESYTYATTRPVPIDFTSDFKKALITICADLDSRLRCAFEQYVYFVESKTAVRLPAPPDTYGIYWKWSPDGSTLAGAAWGYDQALYKLTHFYSVSSDGEVLTPLDPITNEHWQIAWNPGSKAFHPLTFVTNFQSIFVDGSEKEDVQIAGLEWNDKVECLSFSPDGRRAAFIVRRDLQKDHDLVYTSNSNFTEVSQMVEYDIDSSYLCKVDWSPDQHFVHIGYAYDARIEAGIKPNVDAATQDRLVNVDTASLIETRKDARICGWMPDNDLVIEIKDIAGNEGGIKAIDPTNLEPVSLSAGLQSVVKHCPVQWLKEDLVLDIPIGLSVPNACHPGSTFQDGEDDSPELFDFVKASASLNGETLTTTLTLRSVSADLTDYLTPDVNNFVNGFDILVDVDNNALSGGKFGMEYALSVGILPDRKSVV